MNKKCMFLLAVFACAAIHSTAQSWNLTGNSNATTSSKLGTTNAVPLRLFTNNVQRVTITANGFMGINTTAPPGLFTVQSNGSVPSALWAPASTKPVFFGFSENLNADFSLAAASSDPKQRPLFFGKRSRGTLASPSAVKTDDYLTSMAVYAYDGGSFQIPATIDFYADGTPSTGKVPARISFVTGSNAGNRLERLKIGSTGDINLNAGQLFVQQSTGTIGIGTAAPTSNANVEILNPNRYYGINTYNNFTGNEDRVGLYSYSVENPGWGYGVRGTGGFYGVYGVAGAGNYTSNAYGLYGYATGTAGNRYGVYGNGSGGQNVYGVYGYASGGTSFNAAGYFDGDVWAVTFHNISDRKFKTGIAPLQNALQHVMSLKPSIYQFKKDDDKMGLPAGPQIGLIADEVKQVLPELVQAAVRSARFKPGTKEIESPEVKYESVNYIGLIPVLVGSIQELKKQNDDLKKEIEDLKEMVKQLAGIKDIKTGLSSVTLEQNNPNPLDKFTAIRYSLPAGSSNAQLVVTDMSGKTIKQVQLTSADGNVSFDAAGLASGTYSYSIIVNGKLMQTKKMVVARANQ